MVQIKVIEIKIVAILRSSWAQAYSGRVGARNWNQHKATHLPDHLLPAMRCPKQHPKSRAIEEEREEDAADKTCASTITSNSG